MKLEWTKAETLVAMNKVENKITTCLTLKFFYVHEYQTHILITILLHLYPLHTLYKHHKHIRDTFKQSYHTYYTMSDALQLFNFRQTQEEQVNFVHTEIKKKRKRKEVTTIAKGVKVQYICSGCEKQITIETTSQVQCPSCNNRIVDKLRSKKAITYNAD